MQLILSIKAPLRAHEMHNILPELVLHFTKGGDKLKLDDEFSFLYSTHFKT